VRNRLEALRRRRSEPARGGVTVPLSRRSGALPLR
jgi:hypothetical protein